MQKKQHLEEGKFLKRDGLKGQELLEGLALIILGMKMKCRTELNRGKEA